MFTHLLEHKPSYTICL